MFAFKRFKRFKGFKEHVQIGSRLIRVDTIREIDFFEVEDLRLKVYVDGDLEPLHVEGIQAIDLMMRVRPSALENRRLRWKKNIWAFHNLLGHPIMQIAAFFKQYEFAMWIHDVTVPRPKEK